MMLRFKIQSNITFAFVNSQMLATRNGQHSLVQAVVAMPSSSAYYRKQRKVASLKLIKPLSP
jgi:hypothetical protein